MPFVSRGEPFLRADGSVEMLPMQVFRHPLSGATVLRIGRNVFFFNERGYPSGCEGNVSGMSAEQLAAYEAALHMSMSNHGKAPDHPYYGDPDVPPDGVSVEELASLPLPTREIVEEEDVLRRLHKAETAAWPKKEPLS